MLEPIDKNSPISKFLEKNPKGGIHHICCEVNDINKAKEKMSNVDNLDLVGIDEYNVDEVLITAKEDYWKKANKEGRSQ